MDTNKLFDSVIVGQITADEAFDKLGTRKEKMEFLDNCLAYTWGKWGKEDDEDNYTIGSIMSDMFFVLQKLVLEFKDGAE